MLSASKIINSFLQHLTPAQKEVIIGRFGLAKSNDGETLVAIGDRLGVTRERVRQIEKSALESLKKQLNNEQVCLQILSRSKKYLKDLGGSSKKDPLIEHAASFVEGLNENHLALLIEASTAFNFHSEDDDFWPFYHIGQDDFKTVASFVDKWVNFLKSHKKEILSGSYNNELAGFIKANRISKTIAENFLSISKKIHQNPYGDFGLRDWPEIKPATTKDRAYLILKKRNKPLHFNAIAEAINKDALGGAQLALAPTVHNELIKDPRFVLVGRGIYGLSEQGYEPGIAREVIQKILKKNGSLAYKDVVTHLQKQRFFKPNTILINLQNKDFFERLPDGRYRVRES